MIRIADICQYFTVLCYPLSHTLVTDQRHLCFVEMDAVTAEFPQRFRGSGSGTDAAGGTDTGRRAGRRDGRSSGAMRELSASHGALSRADGSARLRVGLTDVMAAVYGPMDCPVVKQVADRSDVHISFKRASQPSCRGSSSSADYESSADHVIARDIKELLKSCLLAVLHPRKAVAVSVLVFSDDGGVMAAVINVTLIALLDAGVPMRSVFCASSISVVSETLLVDPNSAEEVEASGTLTVVYSDPYGPQSSVIAVHSRGDCCGGDIFDSAVSCAKELSTRTLAFVQLAIEGKFA